MTLEQTLVLALMATTLFLLVVTGVQRWRLDRIRQVMHTEREELRLAWKERDHAKRMLRIAEERWQPGYEVSVQWHHGDTPSFLVSDRRDLGWDRKTLAACTSQEAADAAIRLLSSH